MFKTNNLNNIEFFTEFSELLDQPPVPAQKFYPEWFKKMKPGHDVAPSQTFPFGLSGKSPLSNINATIKRCPGVISFLSQGYIIPLWSDFVVQIRQDNIFAFASNESTKPSLHNKDTQFNTMPNLDGYYPEAVKFTNPWKVKTPEGWSVLTLQPFYHFDQRYQITPGVVDSDKYHNLHSIAFFKDDVADHHLKMGMPFMQVIPFQRESLDLQVRLSTPDDKERLKKVRFNSNRFFGKNKAIKK